MESCKSCNSTDLHLHGRCIECHRAQQAAYQRKHRSKNKEKCKQQDRSRKRRNRAEGTAYAERQRERKRRPDIKARKNTIRRSEASREKQCAYQAQYRLREDVQARARARVAVQHAIARGDLIRPSTCEDCGGDPGKAADGRSLIRADHFMGYERENYLNVQWVCTTCDGSRERERRMGSPSDTFSQ